MTENLQHVQLPNSMTVNSDLTPKDLLIYVSIKRYMNKDTKQAFPSQDLICKNASSTKPTVKKCTEKLVELGYIKVRKDGRKNVYIFNSHKNFEPFSYEFLDREDLSASTKAHLLATQQFMFKDVDKYGKVTMNDFQLSQILNTSPQTISRCNKELEEKGYLSIIKTSAKDSDTGLVRNEKMYHLDELSQAIVFTLQNHEDRLNDTDAKIKALEKQIEILLKANAEANTKKNIELEIV
jgi:DNA-binding MarR family transcriptional regulator